MDILSLDITLKLLFSPKMLKKLEKMFDDGSSEEEDDD